MKKVTGILLCLSFVLLCAFALADVKINKTSFPDSNFRTYVRQFDKNKNGILSNSELKAVKTINVSGQNIGNMTGIQYFTSLTKLVCSNNPLTKLDVKKNNALKTLICNDTDVLRTVIIGKKTSLKRIELNEDALVSLDVSGCPALTYLDVDGNKLSKLNVSHNPALTTLRVGSYDSSGSGNNLKSLDVSKNKKLTRLECAHNPLKKINVSKCSSLVKLVKNNKRYHFSQFFDYWESGKLYLTVPDSAIVIAGNKTSKPFEYWTEWSKWSTERKNVDDNDKIEEDYRHHWWAAKCKNCGTHNPYWGSSTKCVGCKKYLPSSNVEHVNIYTKANLTLKTLNGRSNGTVMGGRNYWHAGIEYRYRYYVECK